MNYVNTTESQFKQIITNFESELKSVHTGSAHAALVEDIKVNHYNSVMPLKQIASISSPSAQEIIIRPWDQGALQPIETALREAGRNFNPVNDGSVIRINLPPLSGERRQELIKLVTRQAEEAKVGLRNHREEAIRQVKDSERKSTITQDDRYRMEKQLNELIANYNSKIDSLVDAKTKSLES